MSGMRCGVVHSKNALLTRDRGALDTHMYLGCVPPIVQDKLRLLITDEGMVMIYLVIALQSRLNLYAIIANLSLWCFFK